MRDDDFASLRIGRYLGSCLLFIAFISAPVFSHPIIQQEAAKAAAQLVAEATKLRAEGTKDSLQAAIEKFKAALPLWQQVGDKMQEGNTVYSIGSILSLLGDKQAALQFFRQSLALRQASKDRRGEAESFNGIGNIYNSTNRPQEAIENYQQALAIRQELGDQRGQGVTLSNLGRLLSTTNPPKAIEAFEQALKLLRVVGDRRAVAGTLGNMGALYGTIAEREQTLAAFQEAREIYRAIGDRVGEAGETMNIGLVHMSDDEYEKALESFLWALPILRTTGDARTEAATLANLGILYNELGDPQRALEFNRQGVALFRKIGDRRAAGMALESEAQSHDLLHDLEKAKQSLAQANQLYQDMKDEAGIGRVLRQLGLLTTQQNDLPRALTYYQEALPLLRKTGQQSRLIELLMGQCNIQISLGEFPPAQQSCAEALTISRALNLRSYQAETLRTQARLAVRQNDLSQARRLLEESISLFESVRTTVVNPNSRASFIGKNAVAYAQYVDLLMQLHRQQPTGGFDVQAWQFQERMRARGLQALLREAQSKIRQGVDAALLAREQSLRSKLKAKATLQTRLLTDNKVKEAESLDREIAEITTEYERLQSEIRLASPRYAALIQPPELQLSELQPLLDPDTVLIEYWQGTATSNNLYVWTVTSKTIESFVIPRQDVAPVAARYLELLLARNQSLKFEKPEDRSIRIRKAEAEVQAAGQKLSQLILAPLAAQLNKKKLLIVADGILHNIPFAALPEPESRVSSSELRGRRRAVQAAKLETQNSKPLIVQHEIVNLPSASTLVSLRRELKDRQPAPKTIAVFADPVFDAADGRLQLRRDAVSAAPAVKPSQNLERAWREVDAENGERDSLQRLPYTRQEAQAILQLVPPAARKEALDFAANQEAVLRGDLQQYRYVHFATHGFLNNQHPDLSGIVLSLVDQQGREVDGFLRMAEVYNLNLPAELVVLSGCRTGLGKEIRGEGLMSLTRGFMYAGAARVMVSLWDVNDKATAELMARFYQGLLQKKLSPAAALRAAQLSLARDPRWSSAYYWAGFSLQGEPR